MSTFWKVYILNTTGGRKRWQHNTWAANEPEEEDRLYWSECVLWYGKATWDAKKVSVSRMGKICSGLDSIYVNREKDNDEGDYFFGEEERIALNYTTMCEPLRGKRRTGRGVFWTWGSRLLRLELIGMFSKVHQRAGRQKLKSCLYKQPLNRITRFVALLLLKDIALGLVRLRAKKCTDCVRTSFTQWCKKCSR